MHLGGAEGEQTANLGGLVLGVEVEMDSRWDLGQRAHPVEGHVRPHAVAWSQDHEVINRHLGHHVVERGRPESHLARQIIDTDHDRSDAHHADVTGAA